MTYVSFVPLKSSAEIPPNLDKVKQKLIQYHDSGQYQKDVEAVVQKAMVYLKKRIQDNQKLNQPKKLAIVFDIDETVLSNYAHMRRLNFGGTLESIKKAESEGNDPVIPATLKLYRLAQENHVAVFFVTGRRQSDREPTVKNLQRAGFKHWQKLFMKPDDYHQASAIPYKAKSRKLIEVMGYDIVLSIGDQESDLKGGYADKHFKLPNPFYHIP